MGLDASNKFMVGARGKEIIMLNPPTGPISQDDAIVLAAWLVALSTEPSVEFRKVFEAVCNT